MFFVQGRFASLQAAGILTLLILLSVAMTMVASWTLSRTILKGQPSSFVFELPPYRRPQILRVLVRSLCDRTIFVLGRAVLTAAPVSLLIWIFANVRLGDGSILQLAANFFAPIGTFLGMDGVVLMAFLLGLPANEIVLPIVVTAYTGVSQLTDYGSLAALQTLLLENGWGICTAVCYLLFTLFHWPCATTLLTIRKETGRWQWALVGFLLPTIIGVIICALVRLGFQWMGG